MIESPVLQELKAEWTRETKCEDIIRFLAARFGAEAHQVEAELNGVADEGLGDLIELAAISPDLESFRKQLSR
jgi:hypothetical protein